jgi:hypothetical protein
MLLSRVVTENYIKGRTYLILLQSKLNRNFLLFYLNSDDGLEVIVDYI